MNLLGPPGDTGTNEPSRGLVASSTARAFFTPAMVSFPHNAGPGVQRSLDFPERNTPWLRRAPVLSPVESELVVGVRAGYLWFAGSVSMRDRSGDANRCRSDQLTPDRLAPVRLKTSDLRSSYPPAKSGDNYGGWMHADAGSRPRHSNNNRNRTPLGREDMRDRAERGRRRQIFRTVAEVGLVERALLARIDARFSITMLSIVFKNSSKLRSADGTVSGPSHQPGLDRAENLFPRRTKSFFAP